MFVLHSVVIKLFESQQTYDEQIFEMYKRLAGDEYLGFNNSKRYPYKMFIYFREFRIGNESKMFVLHSYLRLKECSHNEIILKPSKMNRSSRCTSGWRATNTSASTTLSTFPKSPARTATLPWHTLCARTTASPPEPRCRMCWTFISR